MVVAVGMPGQWGCWVTQHQWQTLFGSGGPVDGLLIFAETSEVG